MGAFARPGGRCRGRARRTTTIGVRFAGHRARGDSGWVTRSLCPLRRAFPPPRERLRSPIEAKRLGMAPAPARIRGLPITGVLLRGVEAASGGPDRRSTAAARRSPGFASGLLRASPAHPGRPTSGSALARPVATERLVRRHELVAREGRHEREIAGEHGRSTDLGQGPRPTVSDAAEDRETLRGGALARPSADGADEQRRKVTEARRSPSASTSMSRIPVAHSVTYATSWPHARNSAARTLRTGRVQFCVPSCIPTA